MPRSRKRGNRWAAAGEELVNVKKNRHARHLFGMCTRFSLRDVVELELPEALKVKQG